MGNLPRVSVIYEKNTNEIQKMEFWELSKREKFNNSSGQKVAWIFFHKWRLPISRFLDLFQLGTSKIHG